MTGLAFWPFASAWNGEEMYMLCFLKERKSVFPLFLKDSRSEVRAMHSMSEESVPYGRGDNGQKEVP